MPSFKHQQMFNRCGISLNPLRPLKILKSERFYTFDTETKDGLRGKDLYCYAFCECNHNSFKNTFVDKDDLTHLFCRLNELIDKKRYTIVYVHNLGFDIRFIIKYCLDNNIDYHPIISGSNFIACIIESIRVKFIDSFQFLLCSQDIAEKIYNIPSKYRKIDCKYIFNKKYKTWTNYEKDLVLKHNKNDVIALYLIIKTLRENIFNIAKLDLLTVLSSASLAMKAYRKMMDKPIQNPFVYQQFDKDLKRVVYQYDKEKFEYVKRSYFGGRTEVFDCAYHKEITVFDRVSMYPAVMKNKRYPKGFGINYSNNKPDKLEMIKMIKSIEKFADYEGFIECIIKLPNIKYPLLAEHRDNKLMFTNCTKNNVFTLPELRYLYNNYHNLDGFYIEPISGFIFYESEDYFSNYINTIFSIKRKSMGSKREIAKGLMNWLYGKFGQSFERKDAKFHLFLTLEQALTFSDKLKPNSFEHKQKHGIHVIIEKQISTSIKAFMNVAIASYITAYARINLTQHFHEFEKNNINVLYCDTDSFAIQSKFEYFVKTGSRLGDWDVEKRMSEVQFLAPKCYIYFDKDKQIFILKLKGIERTKIDEIIEKSKSFNEIYDRIHKQIILNERYLKYKSAMRNCNILSSSTVKKTYKFHNNKRLFINNESIPFDDNNINEMVVVK